MHWLRRTRQILLHVEDSPSRVAAAFGTGVFIAFFPILGIHTAMALVIAVALRFSKVAILMGAWTNNPWTIAPMYGAGTLLGCLVLGVSPAGLTSLAGGLSRETIAAGLGRFLWPFVVGNLLLGAVGGLVSFVILRSLITRRRAGGAGGAGTPPD